MGLTSKAFSDIITFSRASNATRIGPDGKVAYAPHNLVTYSEDFSNAAWITNNSTISSNVLASPGGTVTADRLTEDTNNTDHKVRQTFTFTAIPHTYSVYVKAAERTCVALQAYDGSTLFGYIFNLATGELGSRVSGSSTSVTGAITSVGSGWYRCSITFTPAAAAGQVNVGLASNTTTISYTGDGTSGAYLWGAQVSRGSIPGDYTLTTSAAVYGPRFDYDPVTLAAKGLLIEEQRTNLFTYSEAFDNAAWAKSNATVSANASTAPDGTVTADQITYSGSSYIAGGCTVTASASTTYSVYAKAGTCTIIRLREAFYFGTAAIFDLSSGTLTGGSGTIQPAGNGWYRCSITIAYGVGQTNGSFIYDTNSVSGTLSLWGAQAEVGAFATSYIPTVASTVTRSADVASVNTLSPWFNATEGTLFTEYDTSYIGTPYSIEFNDGTLDNRITFYAASGTQYAYVASGGVAQANPSAATVAINSNIKTAFAYKANDFALSAKGSAVVTDTSGTVPVVSTLVLGRLSVGSANYVNGHLRRVAYYPRRLTNAELQTLTA
jgi:hypothetical protein